MVEVTVDGARAIAVVRLDNPPVNTMEDALLRQLGDAFERLEADREVRAIVLTGTGEKAFAAGADLPELLRILEDRAAIAAHTALTRGVLGRIAACRQPVVAALQASAVGGGFELALSCDFIVADPRAKVGLPEVGLGLIPGAGGTQRLSRRIGAAAATEMILTGRLLKAPDALARGAISAVSEPGAAVAAASELAASLATRPAAAAAAAKQAIRRGVELPLEDGLDVERSLFTEVLAGADAREGVEAFIARREPRFGHR